MPTDRLSVVLRAMAEADGGGSGSPIDRVCVAAGMLLSLRGAGLSLMVDGELRGTAGVSDPGIAVLDEAFVRLRAHAFAEALPLRAVARVIVTRRLRLEETA